MGIEKKKTKTKKGYIETVGIVKEMIRETPDTQTLRIVFPNLSPEEAPFRFNPGQFIMVRPEIDGKKIPRAYSISSSPTRSINNGYIDLTVRQTETPTVSKWLNDRKVNDELLIRGPYGHFYWDQNDENAEEVFMLGGGSGVTPLKSILEYIHDKKFENKVTLLYSVRTYEDLISFNALKNLRDNTKNAVVKFTLTREPEGTEWTGRRGRINFEWITEEFKNSNYNFTRTKCYICGIPTFVQTMTDLLVQAGISKDRILHEKWD